MSLTLATLRAGNLFGLTKKIRQPPPKTETAWPCLLLPPPPGFHIYFITVDSKLQQRREYILQHHHSKILLKWNTVEYKRKSWSLSHLINQNIWKEKVVNKEQKSRHCFLHTYILRLSSDEIRLLCGFASCRTSNRGRHKIYDIFFVTLYFSLFLNLKKGPWNVRIERAASISWGCNDQCYILNVISVFWGFCLNNLQKILIIFSNEYFLLWIF